jgi:toxin YoeB
MEIDLTDEARKDMEFWKQSNDQKIMTKITNLILSIQQAPYTGIGKPGPLKYELKGL